MKKSFYSNVLTAILASSMIFTACSAQKTQKTSDGKENEKIQVVEPLGKYSPEIELTAARDLGSYIKYPDGDSPDNNVWYRGYKQELGINIKNELVAEGQAYAQKVNISIASNQIPDLLRVNQEQMVQMAEAGMIQDLNEVFEKYAIDEVKNDYKEAGIPLKAATVKDKLMAIPTIKGIGNGIQILWVRSDWMENVNITRKPETIEDVVELCRAFVNNDPDKNGKKDTLGLPITNDLGVSFDGFVAGFGAYKKIWVKDSSGKLIYGSIAPEMKNALAKLAEMYKEGLIDKEFSVKNWGAVRSDRNAAKFGIWHDNMAATAGLAYVKKAQPECDFNMYPIPSVEKGKIAKSPIDIKPSEYWVVSKDCKNPEALIKMINFYYEKIESPRADASYHTPVPGYEAFLVAIGPRNQPLSGNIKIAENINKALEKKSVEGSGLKKSHMLYWDAVNAYLAGDKTDSNWAYFKAFGPNNGNLINKPTFEAKRYQLNEFFGLPGSAWTDNAQALEKMRDEIFVKIIIGDQPLSAFDKFVEDWKKLGGEKATKEVNEWYLNSSKK